MAVTDDMLRRTSHHAIVSPSYTRPPWQSTLPLIYDQP
jgi:hypothetical protein